MAGVGAGAGAGVDIASGVANIGSGVVGVVGVADIGSDVGSDIGSDVAVGDVGDVGGVESNVVKAIFSASVSASQTLRRSRLAVRTSLSENVLDINRELTIVLSDRHLDKRN